MSLAGFGCLTMGVAMRSISFVGVMAMAVALTLSRVAAGSLEVADAVNGTHSPYPTSFGIAAMGWVYTPTTSYDLVGIATKFSSADARTVTLEVYDAHPLYGGGTLLRSVGFTPLANDWAGGQFAPLTLTAGEDYFIGFQNVGGLGVNWSWSFPTEMLDAWSDRDSDRLYEESAPQLEFRSAILRFYTESAAVPSPSSFTVFGLLIACAALRQVRRSRPQSVH